MREIFQIHIDQRLFLREIICNIEEDHQYSDLLTKIM